MATIRKYQGKGGISWQVRIRKKGKLLNGSFPSKRLAEDWARKIEHDIVQDTYLPEQKKPTTHAVHDLIALYLERLMPQKDPTTQRCQTPMLKWWDSVLADIPINHVTVALLEDYKYLLLNQYLRQNRGKVVRCRVELRCARRQLKHHNGTHLWLTL